jgi:tellurite resistance protein TehA-like permease
MLQFAVTMGTGIVSIILHTFSDFYPRYHGSLRILGIIFFVLNVVLFILISTITILRYVLYPGTWKLMIRHPVQSLFIGCLPMGFATIINMFCAICVPAWGGATHHIAWAMWWVDAVISVACCFGLPWQM